SGNNRLRQSHGFEDRDGEAFHVGGVDIDVGGGDEGGGIRAPTEKTNRAPDTPLVDRRPQSLQVAGILLTADGSDDDVVSLTGDGFSRLDECLVALVRADVADMDHELGVLIQTQFVANVELGVNETGWVDPILDDFGWWPGKSLQALSHCRRHRRHSGVPTVGRSVEDTGRPSV